MGNAAAGNSPGDSRVFFFVNLLPRFVTDFGAVAWCLSGLGIPSSDSSSGRPIVTCDNVGGREFVTHGETGLIVPPSAPVALADAIDRLIRDEHLAQRLRRNAFHHFKRGYTKDVMVASTLAVFRDLGMAVPSGVSSGAEPVERVA